MFPPITVFIIYPAVIPCVCVYVRVFVCVCVLRIRGMKLIGHLYNPLKLSAFFLCALFDCPIFHPLIFCASPPPEHMINSFSYSCSSGFVSASFSPSLSLSMSLEHQCFMKIVGCFFVDCRNWLEKNPLNCCFPGVPTCYFQKAKCKYFYCG